VASEIRSHPAAPAVVKEQMHFGPRGQRLRTPWATTRSCFSLTGRSARHRAGCTAARWS